MLGTSLLRFNSYMYVNCVCPTISVTVKKEKGIVLFQLFLNSCKSTDKHVKLFSPVFFFFLKPPLPHLLLFLLVFSSPLPAPFPLNPPVTLRRSALQALLFSSNSRWSLFSVFLFLVVSVG